jgi:hypothetical protein
MSYLSERQCQFCVDRGVASTQRTWPQMHNALALPAHNARHQPKFIDVGVRARSCLYLYAAGMEISRYESWNLLRHET